MRKSASGKGRTCGFRCSVLDISILLSLLIAFLLTAGLIRWIIVFVVGHFFLFCNIFRVRPKFEYIWAVIFLANVGIWHLSFAGDYELMWFGIMITQVLVTIAVIIAEMRSPRYHGIFCRRINAKHIDDYLSGKIK